MRIGIHHETHYRYQQPVNGLIQTLRLTPRNHDGQYVVGWRIEVSADCRLGRHEDAFGNLADTFSLHGAVEGLTVLAAGEVDTEDRHGVVAGTMERLPPSLFLRETDLTRADPAIQQFAREFAATGSADRLERLHQLLARLHAEMTYDTDPTHAATTAAESFALRRGVCQDITHIFIALARRLGVPARYISGYFHDGSGTVQTAGHAWAEAHVEGLGWVGFDATHGVCVTDAHVRVAVGLDALGAAPVRGSRFGGSNETLDVKVNVGAAPLLVPQQAQVQQTQSNPGGAPNRAQPR